MSIFCSRGTRARGARVHALAGVMNDNPLSLATPSLSRRETASVVSWNLRILKYTRRETTLGRSRIRASSLHVGPHHRFFKKANLSRQPQFFLKNLRVSKSEPLHAHLFSWLANLSRCLANLPGCLANLSITQGKKESLLNL